MNCYDESIIAAYHSGNLLRNAILAIDMKGEIVHISDKASEILGIPFANLLQKKITNILPDTKILNVLTGGKPVVCTEIGHKGDRFVTHYFPWIENELQVGALGFFVPSGSTAGVREELEAYRFVNAMYEAVLDDVAVGIVLVNIKGKVIYANRVGLLQLSVKDQTTLLLHNLSEAYPQLEIEPVLCSGITNEPKVVSLNGEEIVVHINPLFQKDEQIGAVIIFISKDKADNRELVEQLQLLTTRLNYCKREIKSMTIEISPFWTVIGESPNMKKLKRLAERVSKGDATVLITGESGTGKGVFAQAIHRTSPRANHTFVHINCAAIPDNLLESELFGYEEGAFTGAVKGGRKGKLEMANQGTLFLDEIGDMPLAMQAKILRVLQERSFERIGGRKTIQVDVRVIAATNQDLLALIEEGKFRLDLYYRLSVINIHLPPLRERGNDVLLLASRSIDSFNSKYGTEVEGLSSEVEALFLEHAWPGNIRQMENVLEYAFNMLDDDQNYILRDDLPEDFYQKQSHSSSVCMESALNLAEKETILRALRQSGGNKKKAAMILAIPRSSLYEKIKKYGLKGIDQ